MWREVGKDTLSSLEPFSLYSQSGSTAGHFQSPAGAVSSLKCSGIAGSVTPLPLRDSFSASIPCSKLRFCCDSLNRELLTANVRSGDPWLGNVVLMKWWLLSDGEWETARLLAGTVLSSLWAGACTGLSAQRREVSATWCMWRAPKSSTSSCLPDWRGYISCSFPQPPLASEATGLGLSLCQEWGWWLILLNLCFDFIVASAW